MPIEAKCPGCERLLRVDDEYAGKEARCPVCSTIYRVPERAAAVLPGAELVGGREGHAEILPSAAEEIVSAEDATPPDTSRWFMRTPEGQTFGPVFRIELNRWVTEGRVTHDCELKTDDGPWRSADQVYAALRVPAPQYFAGPGPAPTNAATAALSPGTRLAPHRGGLILTLALVGFMSGCAILSIMAWVMGNGDLREMREGRMDPDGQSLTQAGYMLGMILSIVWILAAVVGLFIVLVVAANK